MKNVLYWSFILSVVAVILSIVAICNTYPRQIELGLDYQGWITGVLALLVTALIGLNIFSLVDFKNKEKEIYANTAPTKRPEDSRIIISLTTVDSIFLNAAFFGLKFGSFLSYSPFLKLSSKEK